MYYTTLLTYACNNRAIINADQIAWYIHPNSPHSPHSPHLHLQQPTEHSTTRLECSAQIIQVQLGQLKRQKSIFRTDVVDKYDMNQVTHDVVLVWQQ